MSKQTEKPIIPQKATQQNVIQRKERESVNGDEPNPNTKKKSFLSENEDTSNPFLGVQKKNSFLTGKEDTTNPVLSKNVQRTENNIQKEKQAEDENILIIFCTSPVFRKI